MTSALIAARGGSIRLPRKNVRPFCGIPLVAWSVIAARCSHLIDEVYVITDDKEIGDIASQYGAKLIADPPRIEGQSVGRVFIHGIREIRQKRGTDFNTVLTILPTTPLNLPGDFDAGIKEYRRLGCDWIGPMIPLREVYLMRKIHPSRCKLAIFDKRYNFVTQAGGWIVTSPHWYLNFNGSVPAVDEILDNSDNWPQYDRYFFPCEVWQGADVDTAEEFELAGILMEHYILKGRGPQVYEDYANEGKQTIEQAVAAHAGNMAQQ